MDTSVFAWSTAKVVRVSSDGFLHNLSVIFDCFVGGRMYGLQLPETQEMFEYDGPDEQLFIFSNILLS